MRDLGDTIWGRQIVKDTGLWMNISTSNVRTVGLNEAQAETFTFSGRILKEVERLTWI